MPMASHRWKLASWHDSGSRESMFISVGKDGTVALREGDDFKRLHIEAADGDVSPETVRRALAPHATFEDNSFWLDVEWLKALSGRAGGCRVGGEFCRDDRERAEIRL